MYLKSFLLRTRWIRSLWMIILEKETGKKMCQIVKSVHLIKKINHNFLCIWAFWLHVPRGFMSLKPGFITKKTSVNVYCEYKISPMKTRWFKKKELPYVSKSLYAHMRWYFRWVEKGAFRKERSNGNTFFFFTAHMICLFVGTGATVLWNHFPEIPHKWLPPCMRGSSLQRSSHNNRPMLSLTSNNDSECGSTNRNKLKVRTSTERD